MLRIGQKVAYLFYGVEETAIVTKISSGIVFVINSTGKTRWMHTASISIQENDHVNSSR